MAAVNINKPIVVKTFLASVLVFFLMPFSTLSCAGTKFLTMSGAQMAFGTTVEAPQPFTNKPKKQEIKGNALAAGAALAAVLALGFAFVGGRPGKFGSAAFAVGATLALFALKSDVDAEALKQGQGMFGVQWEFGYWLSMFASAVGAACVVLIPDADVAPPLVEAKASEESAPQP